MTVHIVGAGLAGLSAAVALSARDIPVILSEAAPQAGGRCRSYTDSALGMTIDNGNHLVLSGNSATAEYLQTIGAGDRLAGPDTAEFTFVELPSLRQWRLRPNRSAIPWWVLSEKRRVPDTGLRDYLSLSALLRPSTDDKIEDVISCEGPLWNRLLHPLLLAALNTEPARASAKLAASILRETLAKGGDAYRPRIASPSLSAAFVDPALSFIEARGGEVRLGRRLATLTFEPESGRAESLQFADGTEALGKEDTVILALPPWVARDLVPQLTVPDAYHAIVNAHFAFTPPADAPPMIGVINGKAEWIFCFHDRISITVSSADRLVGEDRETLARDFWEEVSTILKLPPDLPPWQIVKEKRATFAATVEEDRKRPPAETRWPNLFLAGDWTDTGLPATIEGAIRSGRKAASLAGA